MLSEVIHSRHSYWAIRLALGTAEPGDIPEPKTGLLVTDIRKPRLVRSIA